MLDRVTRGEILAEAREWLGTPFHHQARVKGVGSDCAQLVIGVGQNLGLVPDYPSRYMNYGRAPRPRQMRERLTEFMDEIPSHDAMPGDVLWMGFRKGLPMHVGILTDLYGRGIIHAYSVAGKVVETALPDNWERNIDSWWRYRGVI